VQSVALLTPDINAQGKITESTLVTGWYFVSSVTILLLLLTMAALLNLFLAYLVVLNLLDSNSDDRGSGNNDS